ncbi:hypothetical protein OTSSIDO_0467 [Orientia tsutsugamushi str. Sido]|nr:hypothetical protein OTSSIDO_0467 [Orientia tsutsugamushi str. Sido]
MKYMDLSINKFESSASVAQGVALLNSRYAKLGLAYLIGASR